MNRSSTLVLVAAITTSLTFLGCAQGDDEELATASVTSALQASQQGGLTRDFADVEGEAAIDPAKAAAFILARAPRRLSPEGCMTKTRSGNTIHLVFSGCTGPLGKLRLDGSADMTFTLDDQKRLVTDVLGGSDLEANGRALAYHGRGVIEVAGDVRNVTWHVDASGQTKRGREYSRSTDLTLSVDVAKRCLNASGVARGRLAGLSLDVTVDDFAICEHACPTSGHAHATLTGPAGRERSIDVVLDGTDQAHVTNAKGAKRDITMACDDGEAAE